MKKVLRCREFYYLNIFAWVYLSERFMTYYKIITESLIC